MFQALEGPGYAEKKSPSVTKLIFVTMTQRLKQAMLAIEQILRENDIAGVVVIAEPGASEYLVKLDAGWSGITSDKNKIRVKLTQAEFPTTEAYVEKATNTANALSLLADTLGVITLGVMDISKQVDDKLNAEHSPLRHVPHEDKSDST